MLFDMCLFLLIMIVMCVSSCVLCLRALLSSFCMFLRVGVVCFLSCVSWCVICVCVVLGLLRYCSFFVCSCVLFGFVVLLLLRFFCVCLFFGLFFLCGCMD